MKRHKTELKWIKFLQLLFPLGFNDNIYHEGNNSKCQNLMFFLLTLSAKFVLKPLNTSLKDLSIALNNHGWHGLFSFLSSLPISA